MIKKLDTLINTSFALLASWVIFAATPYFWLNGHYPQVDSQIIYLHGICGIFYFYQGIQFFYKKKEIEKLLHPLILIPILLALLGVISSFLSGNINRSLSGSPQIGQGVFWYFDLAVMSLIFSQVAYVKKIRLIFFLNLLIITLIATFFTFLPTWKGLPISFYFFKDYLCFYGVLNFILLTTITRNLYLVVISFILLGIYISYLENLSAIHFFSTGV